MKNKANLLWVTVGCTVLNASPLSARNYEKLWKEVASCQQKDLPQSALRSARNIFRKAMDDNNKGEMMRAYLYMLQVKNTLSADSLQPDMKRLEQMTATPEDSVEKAVWHSLLGTLYASNSYRGQYSAKDSPSMPEDMAEWTRNNYMSKARQHFTASLVNIQLLSHTSMSAYLPVIIKGNVNTGDNLLDVLGTTAANALTYPSDTAFVTSFYNRLANFYAGEGNKDGMVLALLRGLNYKYAQGMMDATSYRKRIIQLIRENAPAETCAEAYIALAERHHLWINRRAEQLAFVQRGIKSYPTYARINALKQIETELKRPALTMAPKDNPVPGKPFSIQITWANMGEAALQFYRIKDGYSDMMEKAYEKLLTAGKLYEKQKEHFLKTYAEPAPVITKTFNLTGKRVEMNDSTFEAPALPAGLYLVSLTSGDAAITRNNCQLLPLSSLSAIMQDVTDKGRPIREIRVVDVTSGKPVTDASLLFYDASGKALPPVRVDNQGLVRTNHSLSYRIQSPKDNFFLPQRLQQPASRWINTTENSIHLYTDRSIYRPGQTVRVAGIAWGQDEDSTFVRPHHTLTLTLRDANDGQVAEKKVTTNDYGSFATAFTLPESALSGEFSINTTSAGISFRVEEYKRPTFDVTFEPLHAGYKAGDSISVVGRARTYSGVPLQYAKVRYTIHVDQRIWRNERVDLPADLSGTATTDDEGHFIVPLRLMKLPEEKTFFYCYEYDIKAQVLSDSGETQEGSWTLPLSNRSLYISMNGLNEGDRLCKETMKPVTIQVRNLQDVPVECHGTYVITPSGKSGVKTNIAPVKGDFSANKTSLSDRLSQLSSGSYLLTATVRDKEKGTTVTDSTTFVLYSTADTRPPVKTDFWHEVISGEIAQGYHLPPAFVPAGGKRKTGGWVYKNTQLKDTAEIQVGSSLKDVTLYYRLYCGDDCIEDRLIPLNDSMMTFRYAYKPEYRKGLRATFAFVKDGKLHQASDDIRIVEPDKKLTIAWDSFRDKLEPGQKEEWTMWIARNDNRKLDGAEVLASMYDASLDKFTVRTPGNRWELAIRPWQAYCYPGAYITYANTNAFPYLAAYFPLKDIWKYQPLTFSRLTIYPEPWTNRMVFDTAPVTRTFLAGSHGVLAENTVGNRLYAAPQLSMDISMKKTEASQGTAETNHSAPRTDFQETAFFYPHLQTDKQGKVTIAFTLPDALTRWHFRAVAHTKDMLTATSDTTITASKDFMVQPNLPRYTRAGDVVSFPVSLTNFTARNLSGTARMELLNPDNNQIIYTESQRFTLSGGKTYGLHFTWKADGKYPAVICRIQAASGNKSDGEQNWLPIVPDKELITESIALSVNGPQEKQYDLTNLFQKNDKDATDRHLTIEFTSNPVWYAIQALPTMAESRNDDALSLSSALYAESVARYIVAQYPRLRNVFEQWRQENGTSQSLWSNLQKNPELKTILLNETPWVAEAASETERKQRLSTLFDVNALTYKTTDTLQKLAALQREDGSWSWYKGMESSDYITLAIAEQLARLEKLTNRSSSGNALLTKAITYLDKKVEEIYRRQKDNSVKGHAPFVLRTCYIKALLGQLPSDKVTTYFLDGWEKHPAALSLEDKARCAIVMQAAGRTATAEDNLKSLLEHTVSTDELGRYFDRTAVRTYFWEDNRIPVQTLVMEALKNSGKHEQEVEEMSRWLLKQKQTQAWANAVQSANSIYALLIGNASQTLENQVPATVTVNGSKVVTDKDIASLGYIHYTYTSGDIIHHPSTLTIRKTTPGVGWGGIYARYTLPLEKIISTTTANDSVQQSFSVRREFYIKRTEGGKAVRYPLDKVMAKVGDLLISRLIVKTDRDMEFVQIKDGRASCAEPAKSISGYSSTGNTGYYEVPRDASTDYFCDRMNKGTYIFENTSFLDRSGSYTTGTASVQCAYAPEFITRAEPVRINVK